ncbi:50S ribosomal protein L9 [bacterium]|nr:50S ribosomal protein L9 [bacterium]
MRVILNKDVKDIGKAGQIVDVSEGYARNYLMPRNLAAEATETALKAVADKAKREAIKAEKLKAEMQEYAGKIAEKTVTMPAKAGEGGRLYGAITAKEIALETKKQTGFEIDKRKIEMEDAIRALGYYDLAVKVHPEVTAKLRVHVVEAK